MALWRCDAVWPVLGGDDRRHRTGTGSRTDWDETKAPRERAPQLVPSVHRCSLQHSLIPLISQVTSPIEGVSTINRTRCQPSTDNL